MSIILKNRKKRDCGVVAAYNAAFWCGSIRPYSEIEKVAKSCGYSPSTGIYDFQFSYLMKKLGVPTKKIKPKSIEALQEMLYVGKCVVLLYTQTGKNTGHVVTVFMDHKGDIRIFNPGKELRNWSRLVADIKNNGMKDFNIYEISKRNMRYDVARAT